MDSESSTEEPSSYEAGFTVDYRNYDELNSQGSVNFHNGSTNDSLQKALRDYYDALDFEKKIGVAIPIIYALVIFIGVTGNTLVIVVVGLNTQMRNSTNFLIVNLAAVDLLFLLFCVPFTAADFALPVWVFSNAWCSCLFYLQFVTAYASVWTLVLMATDRFLAVVFPVQSLTLRTIRNTFLASALLWTVILLGNINQLSVHGVYDYQFVLEHRQSCAFLPLANASGTESQVRWHFLTFTVCGYGLPLLVSCLLYFVMLHKLWFKMPILPAKTIRPSGENSRSKAKRKVTMMISGVIVTFAICWLPLNICFAYTGLAYRQHFGPPNSKGFALVMMASQVLAYTNSCLNPILYAFLSENFRKAFFKVIQSCSFNKRQRFTREIEAEKTEPHQTLFSRRSLSLKNSSAGCSKNGGAKAAKRDNCREVTVKYAEKCGSNGENHQNDRLNDEDDELTNLRVSRQFECNYSAEHDSML